LVRHFVDTYTRGMDKRIETIPDSVMGTLCRYSWPGNIRELQNFIERSVILSAGSLFDPPLAELERSATALAGTLDDAERQHILKVLEQTGWVIGGARGAASMLGLKRTTLISKMERLHISRASDKQAARAARVIPIAAKRAFR
jgi:formate hydrogenlyase transcriptional activator